MNSMRANDLLRDASPEWIRFLKQDLEPIPPVTHEQYYIIRKRLLTDYYMNFDIDFYRYKIEMITMDGATKFRMSHWKVLPSQADINRMERVLIKIAEKIRERINKNLEDFWDVNAND